jgi:hypothetical protein
MAKKKGYQVRLDQEARELIELLQQYDDRPVGAMVFRALRFYASKFYPLRFKSYSLPEDSPPPIPNPKSPKDG